MDILLPGPATVKLDGTNVGEYEAGKGLIAKVATDVIHDYIAKAGKKLPAESFIEGQGLEIDLDFSETVFANLPKLIPGVSLVTLSPTVKKIVMGGYSGKKMTSMALTVTPLNTPVGNLMTLTVPRVIPVGEAQFVYDGAKPQHWVSKFMAQADIDGSAEGAWILSWGDPSATADVVAPTATVVPADEDAAVSRSTAVTYTVSKALNAATVHSGSILLFSSASDELVQIACGEPVLTNAGASTEIVLTPLATLDALTKHQAILLPTVTDQAGNHFAAANIAEWTTAA